jgi:cation transport ATPase
MLSDANNTHSVDGEHGHVTSVVAVEDHEDHEGDGRRELLRLAAGLGAYLQPPFAEALMAAARSECLVPALTTVEMPQEAADTELGIVAHVEGRQLALGHYNYIVRLGLAPSAVEVHVARRIAAIGNIPLYLMVIDEGRCLGILGIEVR